MKKILLLTLFTFGFIYADCIDGDEFDENGYHCGDIQVLQDLIDINPGDQYQFERHGYFICDQESKKSHIKINRTVTLRDTWK